MQINVSLQHSKIYIVRINIVHFSLPDHSKWFTLKLGVGALPSGSSTPDKRKLESNLQCSDNKPPTLTSKPVTYSNIYMLTFLTHLLSCIIWPFMKTAVISAVFIGKCFSVVLIYNHTQTNTVGFS